MQDIMASTMQKVLDGAGRRSGMDCGRSCEFMSLQFFLYFSSILVLLYYFHDFDGWAT